MGQSTTKPQVTEQSTLQVVVIGCGVVGLTTAIELQESGENQVTILAETIPTDAPNVRYASFWAGAQHSSTADPKSFRGMLEKDTFDILWEMSEPGSPTAQFFIRLEYLEYYPERLRPHPKEHTWKDFRYIPEDQYPSGAVDGAACTTLTIDVPNYIKYLHTRFLEAGGKVIRGSVQHISQVIDGSASTPELVSPDAVVVCAGLGARFIGGIEDKDVYPIRGQTVIIHAPWVDKMLTKMYPEEEMSAAYIIPRKSGDVVLGGIFYDNDWYPNPIPEIAETILKDALALYPELAPPEIRSKRVPTVDDLRPLIVGHGVGLRPARKGGIRLEAERVTSRSGKLVHVVHNYGHGGYGFQSSWGSASSAVKILRGQRALG